jgi:hypothetical protein
MPVQDKPNDREVEELLELFEQKEGPLLRAVDERVKWQSDTLPRWVRCMLVLGAVTMGLAVTGVRYYGSKCFTVRTRDDSSASVRLVEWLATACAHRDASHADAVLRATAVPNQRLDSVSVCGDGGQPAHAAHAQLPGRQRRAPGHLRGMAGGGPLLHRLCLLSGARIAALQAALLAC